MTNAIRLAIFTVAIYITALTVGLRLIYYLAYVLGALLVVAFIWAQINKRGLSVTRRVEPPQATVGQIVQESISIENHSWFPKLWLEVRDLSTLPGHRVGAVISLPSRRTKRWQVRTRCTHRGLYRLGPTVVLTGDPFGLFHFRRVFDQSNELLVYPPTVPLSHFGLPVTELPGGTHAERRAYYTTPNAAGIRDYLPGDPMNRIHWPVSARAQKLMVKEFELDPTADLWLVLDLDEHVHVSELQGAGLGVRNEDLPTGTRQPIPDARQSAIRNPQSAIPLDPTTEEYAVTVTASLAAHFLAQGRAVGLVAWGQHRVALPSDRGGRQLIKILRALAVLRAEGEHALKEVLTAESRQFGRQDTLVVVTPSLEDEWTDALQSQLYRGLRAVTVLIEPGTFLAGTEAQGSGISAEVNPLLLVSGLTAMNVPTYLVKRDDAIDAALKEQYGPGAAKNLR
jgi:uncharacterized protein (DUF58 family)